MIHLNVQMADAYGADGAVMATKIVKMVVMKLSSHVVSMLPIHRPFSYSTKELNDSLMNLGLVHTYPDIFENASFFNRIKKYPRPHEESFRKCLRPHKNASTVKLRCSNFDKRKQTIKMPLHDLQRSVRML